MRPSLLPLGMSVYMSLLEAKWSMRGCFWARGLAMGHTSCSDNQKQQQFDMGSTESATAVHLQCGPCRH
jgi:hypothetical protein